MNIAQNINIDKIAEELGEALVDNRECGYARKFLARVDLGDGRTARLNLVLIIDEGDDLE